MTTDPTRLRDDLRRLELENASLRAALAQSVAVVERHGAPAAGAARAGSAAPGAPDVSAERRWMGRRLARILLVLAAIPTVYYLHVFDLAFTSSYRQTACIAADPAPGERAPTTGRLER